MNHSGSTKQRFENVVVVCPLALNWFRKTRTEMAAGVVMMVCTLYIISRLLVEPVWALRIITLSYVNLRNPFEITVNARWALEYLNVWTSTKKDSWVGTPCFFLATKPRVRYRCYWCSLWIGLEDRKKATIFILTSTVRRTGLLFTFIFGVQKYGLFRQRPQSLFWQLTQFHGMRIVCQIQQRKTGPVTAGKILETSECLAWPGPLTERRVKTSQLRMFLL